ncbi:hypothetical protein JOB18_015971 [Solea senegalensis]|uniref:Uncharacterized protein n=1 Tax=Solea senegalensis TaxID=28829 RepID=A0AAV6Q8J8_SOLSE|nr:hypothetical protein JOB18_015971 [Solea senegalensis]
MGDQHGSSIRKWDDHVCDLFVAQLYSALQHTCQHSSGSTEDDDPTSPESSRSSLLKPLTSVESHYPSLSLSA